MWCHVNAIYRERFCNKIWQAIVILVLLNCLNISKKHDKRILILQIQIFWCIWAYSETKHLFPMAQYNTSLSGTAKIQSLALFINNHWQKADKFQIYTAISQDRPDLPERLKFSTRKSPICACLCGSISEEGKDSADIHHSEWKGRWMRDDGLKQPAEGTEISLGFFIFQTLIGLLKHCLIG